MNTTEIISMDRLPFYSDITRCPLLGSHIHNHRLCWPPDVFVENPILSYNYKNIYVQNACTFCVHVQNILCVYCTRIGQNILPAYNLYGQQSRWSFNKYVAVVSASFCAKWIVESLDEMFCRANILSFCHAQNIYNHRLCWPPDVFVVKPFLSYNYKHK